MIKMPVGSLIIERNKNNKR